MSSFAPTSGPRTIRRLETISLKELNEIVKDSDALKVDTIIPSLHDLRVDENLKLATKQGAEQGKPRLDMSDTALNQLCEKIGIPTRYAKKVRDNTNLDAQSIRGSLAQQANHWIDNAPNKPVLVRMKGDIGPGGGKSLLARALLSKDYQIFDNKHVLEALNKLDGTSMKIARPIIEDDFFHVRIVLPDFKYEISQEGKTKGDLLYGTLNISNSETGRGKTDLEVGVMRLTCTNGMTTKDSVYRFAQAHKGLTTEELFQGICGAMDNVKRILDTVGNRFQASHEVVIEDPIAELRALVEEMELPNYMLDKVKGCFFEEAFNNVFGVTNAITLAAQEQPIERRRMMEAFAGDYLFRQTRGLVGAV